MRFSWRKPKGKGRKAKVPADIRALAKEIVAKRMRQDPEFGLEISMRELKYEEREEPEASGNFVEHKPFKEYMKDVRDMREFMNEFREETKGSSAWVEIGKAFVQSIGQTLGQTLAPMLQNMAKQQRLSALQGVPQIEEGTRPPQAPTQARLSELMNYLEDTPEKAVEDLKTSIGEGNSQAFVWANLIKGRSYAEIVHLLTPFKDNPEYSDTITKLLTQDEGKWFKKFITLVQKLEL